MNFFRVILMIRGAIGAIKRPNLCLTKCILSLRRMIRPADSPLQLVNQSESLCRDQGHQLLSRCSGTPLLLKTAAWMSLSKLEAVRRLFVNHDARLRGAFAGDAVFGEEVLAGSADFSDPFLARRDASPECRH